ncbi:winged helix-turn-helix transcriptional regulator [Arcobacter sp.]|uniref:winged helix-turn-helix transcriptional regulator n=1 Tax=Arcobacter sp. TaxID=1872629 RepID=UPI003D0DCA1B
MKKIKDKKMPETPFEYTLSLISGKWKMMILYLLSEHKIIRYNELQRKIGSITYKMLSNQLKELEVDKLIIRKEYPMIPPKVEYSLSKKGQTLIPILDSMCEWGSKQKPELAKYI